MTGPDSRRYPPIFGDFAPTSSSRKKHSLPWWHLEEGAEGAEGSGRQGGWGWLVGLAAWWHGGMGTWKGMIDFDSYVYEMMVYIAFLFH